MIYQQLTLIVFTALVAVASRWYLLNQEEQMVHRSEGRILSPTDRKKKRGLWFWLRWRSRTPDLSHLDDEEVVEMMHSLWRRPRSFRSYATCMTLCATSVLATILHVFAAELMGTKIERCESSMLDCVSFDQIGQMALSSAYQFESAIIGVFGSLVYFCCHLIFASPFVPKYFLREHLRDEMLRMSEMGGWQYYGQLGTFPRRYRHGFIGFSLLVCTPLLPFVAVEVISGPKEPFLYSPLQVVWIIGAILAVGFFVPLFLSGALQQFYLMYDDNINEAAANIDKRLIEEAKQHTDR